MYYPIQVVVVLKIEVMIGVAVRVDRITEIVVEVVVGAKVVIGRVVDRTDKAVGLREEAVGAKVRVPGDKVKVGVRAKIGNMDKGTTRIMAIIQTTIMDSIHRIGATHNRLVECWFTCVNVFCRIILKTCNLK